MRRSGRGRPSPMRRAIDQIRRLAPSIRPPMLPVVSRTNATSTRGGAADTAAGTAARAGAAERTGIARAARALIPERMGYLLPLVTRAGAPLFPASAAAAAPPLR